MAFSKVGSEVSEGIENSHVELIVLFGAQAAGSEFGNECRAAFQGIHELPWCFEIPTHKNRLLLNDRERILK